MASEQTQTQGRREQRYALTPGYCGVAVRRPDSGEVMHGHAYDISVIGARIELDERLIVGEQVQLWIDFGGSRVSAQAKVVWQFDDVEDPGPVRMALDFADGLSEADRTRLLAHIVNVGILRAA